MAYCNDTAVRSTEQDTIMKSVGVLIAWNNPGHEQTIHSLERLSGILPVAVALPEQLLAPTVSFPVITVNRFWSDSARSDCLHRFRQTGADYLLFIIGPEAPLFDESGLQRMITCMNDTGAAIIYGDYWELQPEDSLVLRKNIDYQQGSIRDSFRFGPAVLINGNYITALQQKISKSPYEIRVGAWYDLRLRLSECGPVLRMPEPLYRVLPAAEDAGSNGHFAYVDPRNREYQIEMEAIATAHLQRIGAAIEPPAQKPLEDDGSYPVTASVVIPVRNRARTIGDAVHSALAQKTGFPFNVIVVDNHSTDGTTEVLSSIAATDERLVHCIPERNDLLIGGCWNEAIHSLHCGRYAVQLDSDDIYDGTGVLARIIEEFNRHPYALVIGSYTTVNFDLKPLPPGLIDHREWTDTNGMNNALRIAGLGAPRAYHVPTLRNFGFPNVSYGEDYAVVLRLSRSYPVGRIYESLYWCRRWDENSDSSLPPETANRYDHYKDRLRTIEIAARSNRKTSR